MKESIWKTESLNFPTLNADSFCDICIIGGGLTGISLAYYLKDTSYKTILVEQNRLGCSTTIRSTAKLTYLQKDLLSKIKKYRGEKWAKMYYDAQRKTIEEILKIIQKEKISCHLEKSPSYLFVQNEKNIPKLKKEFDLYKKFGAPIQWTDHLPLDCKEKTACFVPDTYVFHPTEYLNGLVMAIQKSNSVRLYENTRMHHFQKKDNFVFVTLQNGKKIRAKKLVFAGHYPTFLFPYLFPVKTYLKKEVICTKPSKNYHFNAINLDQDIFSIRFFESEQIQVIDSKKLGNKAIGKFPYLKEEATQNSFSWSNYDIMTPDSLPVVGSLNSFLYLGTGFNAWGITNSNLAAQILSKQLQKKKHCFQELCDPYRKNSITVSFTKIFNAISNIYHFVASYFPNKSPAHIFWRKGKRIGVVIDSKGVRHEILLTCPHMKCGLRYNSNDQTWDCPCHGSRFDLDGNLLRGPSTECVHSSSLF